MLRLGGFLPIGSLSRFSARLRKSAFISGQSLSSSVSQIVAGISADIAVLAALIQLVCSKARVVYSDLLKRSLLLRWQGGHRMRDSHRASRTVLFCPSSSVVRTRFELGRRIIARIAPDIRLLLLNAPRPDRSACHWQSSQLSAG